MMNGDKILNMPAGREIDSLVAEKVMGLIPCQNEYHKNGDGLPCHAESDSPDMGGETHCYSSDISAAWEVMEKMKEYSPSVLWCMEEKFWYCNLWYSDDSNDILCEGQGDTVPLAICRAALIAVMERIRWN